MHQIKIRYPKNITDKEIEKFFIKIGLKKLVLESKIKISESVDQRIMKIPQPPDLRDLYRLYMFIILNKRTTVLEFGTGYSTLVMHCALLSNLNKFGLKKPFSRCKYPFTIFSLDNSRHFMKISEQRIKKYSKQIKLVKFFYSKANMTMYNGNFAVEYKNLPRVNPDFIYLDGPSQWAPGSDLNNVTTAHSDFMPMSCDIAKIENFLTPGTIVIVDGRTANSYFLKNCFKRKWKFVHDTRNDQCYFLLIDSPLGIYNLEQLNFYNKN
jgi:hypothetical protein